MSVHFDKKSKTWYAHLKIIDKVTGEARWYKKRGFAFKREAVKWEVEKREATADTSSSFITIAIQQLEAKDCNDDTYNLIFGRIKKYFPYINNPIDKITKSDLLKFRSSLKDSGLSTTTKNTIISNVKAVFSFASDMHGLPNISSCLKRFEKTAEDYKEMLIWSVEEFNQFISAEPHPVFKAFFTTLFWTGARRGELIALKKRDVSSDGSIYISKSIRRLKQGEKAPKTPKSKRYVALDDSTFNLIRPLLKLQGPYVFGGEYPLPPNTISNHFTAAIKSSGVKPIRLHDLRHSHASLLIGNGVDVVAVSKRLGHATVTTTLETYTHIIDKSEKDLIEKINSLNN